MLYTQILVNILLFSIGFAGILLNRKNILVILMSIEIMLLSIGLSFATGSVYLCDAMGQIFFLMVLTVAASESAIGLAILIAYFKIRKSISIVELHTLKG